MRNKLLPVIISVAVILLSAATKIPFVFAQQTTGSINFSDFYPSIIPSPTTRSFSSPTPNPVSPTPYPPNYTPPPTSPTSSPAATSPTKKPTRTPTPKPKKTPTPKPGSPTLTPKPGASSCYSSYNPQPQYLGTELCADGSIAPPFTSSYVPPNLVNLKGALGSDYWVGSAAVLFRSETVSSLRGFLDYIKGEDCSPFVGSSYRSYQTQQQLWDDLGCATNPNCGAASPGNSTHQGGITVDLYCGSLDANNSVVLSAIVSVAISNCQTYGVIHPISWDTPHFIVL